MQKFFLSLCLYFFYATSIAQNPTDSLERLLAGVSGDLQRLQWLEQLTNFAFRTDLQTALLYADRGRRLAEKAGDKTWEPRFCEMQGRIYANLLHFDSAMLLLNRATRGYEATGDQKGQANTYLKQAWVHKKRNELTQAAELDLQALRMMEKINDEEGIADCLAQVAEDLFLQEKPEEGLQYALRSVEIAERNGFQQQWIYSMRTAGFIQFKLGKPAEALRYFDEALAKAKILNSMPVDLARLMNDRGNALKHLERYPEALENYRECLQIAEQYRMDMAKSAAWANLGEVYLKMGLFAEALPYQLKTIELQERNGDFYNLAEGYRHISKTYEKLGNFPAALSFERRSRQLSDSTLNAQSDAKISELRTQYETGKKEDTIAAQQALINQQRRMQWLGFGFAALLALLAYNFRRNAVARKKANTLLAAKNAENELLLKEIHHRVKNNLEVVSSLLALQSARIDDPGIKDVMQESQNRVQSIGIVHQKLYQRDNLAAVEMKDYFFHLSENVLDAFGAEGRVQIELAMQELELDVDTAVPIGLIVNELLSNTLKYAFPDGQKGKVKIGLVKTAGGGLHLEVADNGIGKHGDVKGSGFGSQLVTLLSRQLNGALREENQGGTRIYLDFNLNKAA